MDEFSAKLEHMDEEQRRLFARENNSMFLRMKVASEELTQDLETIEAFAEHMLRTIARDY